MKKYLVYGAGHIGRYMAYMYEQYGEAEIVGFIDDDQEKWGKDGVLGGSGDIERFYEETGAEGIVNGLSYGDLRVRVERFEWLKGLGKPIPSLVHPGAVVEPSAKIGVGCFVGAGTVLDHRCELKDNVLINMNCVIGHDVVLGESCFLSSGINLAGYATIGKGCFVGMGVTVVDHVSIGDCNFIGAAACVTKSIEDEDGIYVGVPAKFLKKAN